MPNSTICVKPSTDILSGRDHVGDAVTNINSKHNHRLVEKSWGYVEIILL